VFIEGVAAPFFVLMQNILFGVLNPVSLKIFFEPFFPLPLSKTVKLT